MTTEILTIDKGQCLTDVLPAIPANTIFDKTITGCGATHSEIVNAARHSIIIEPNIPVILGKKAEHPFLFAVYEGITKEDVKAYLAGEHDGYRKIITTPEGFDKKVLPAMHELEIPVYKDYFLLFDECEKAIQDVGYRGDIYLPVEDFFKFENKAMVSATPIVPSDPRFEENGFKILKLVPTYDSRIELTLCTTNNTVAVMRKLLKRLENETVCVFLNSTETILSLIYALRLQGRSRVFCSEKSVRKLKQMNFTDASETLDELAPVNFLTSRFYAAVDIKLDYKPHVILLTDVMRAPFSAVDPQTEVVQAIGRFRNGVARAYHIANTSDNLQCLTREALERRLTGEENIYNQIRQIQPDGEDEAQARFQALNGMAYKRFVTRDGNRNHFMWDNAWTDEQIKAYYRYPSTLTAAYKSAPFRLTVCTAHYPITDADRLRREKAKMNTRELWREVVGQLAKLQTAHSDMEPAFLQEELGNEFAAIVQAFTILGAKRMEELGYSRSKIEAAMTRTEENVLLTAPKMQEAVYAQYKTGDLVACSEINNFLHRLIVNIGIVQQDVYLFVGTVFDNIRYGKPDATREEVIEAAKNANAHEFIMSLPNGYETDIGQRGIKLSGGQKQRLSIARVFLKNPPILIFDEATSALDNESEKVVQDSLEKLAKNRTTFVIAHRLSTIKNAEKIIVLSEDGIEESGTHEELMARKGTYEKLYNMQFHK